MGKDIAAGQFLTLRVDKNSPTPVYAQIADGIKSLIAKGEVAVGTPLPPERVLCEHFGISRMTLRQAYDVLEREGLIESQRGRGTFVALPRIQKQQQEMRSFTEEIVSRGATPSSKLIGFRTIGQSAADRGFFGLADGQQLYEIERVRFADKNPVALELVHIPQYLCPNLERFNLGSSSMYQILEENYGLALAYCTEKISAAQPNRRLRDLLRISGPASVLVVNRQSFTDKGTPAELAVTSYRGDFYTAVVRSVRIKK
ncbi:MAG: GntR family transcriptional regulator [Bryobacteraceae bacterium]